MPSDMERRPQESRQRFDNLLGMLSQHSQTFLSDPDMGIELRQQLSRRRHRISDEVVRPGPQIGR